MNAVGTPNQRIYAGALLYALAAGTLVLVIGGVLLMLAGIDRLNRVADNGKAQRELLIECTTPPEERVPPLRHAGASDCYVRSQARTGEVVGQVGDISVIAAACGAANPGDIPATRECVEEGLSR